MGGCDSVEVISFNHRNAASDPKVLQAIRNADGIGRVFTIAPEGRAWFVMPKEQADVLRAGEPLTYRDVKVIVAGKLNPLP